MLAPYFLTINSVIQRIKAEMKLKEDSSLFLFCYDKKGNSYLLKSSKFFEIKNI